MAASDREREQEIVQWLRSHAPQEWWLWQQAPDKLRVHTAQLPWPYVLPDPRDESAWPRWGLMIFERALNMKRAGDMITEVRGELVRRLRIGATPGYIGEGSSPDAHMLGRMLIVKFELYGRGGPYRYVFTPPMYRFCDVDKMNPDWSKFILPHDFWIQPEVYRETGEIMQGSPLWNAFDPAAINDGGRTEWRPLSLAAMIADTARAADGREALEAIHVALDSWVERYERTGETKPLDEFAWTPAEERSRWLATHESRCEYRRSDGSRCMNRPAFFVRLPSMQTKMRVCRDHLPMDEDYVVTPISEGE